MPVTLVTTVRSVGTLNTEDRRVRDVSPSLIQLEPDAGPLTTLLGKVKSKPTVDPLIEWFEDELLPRFSTLSGDITAAATTMTVANPTYFRAGDIVSGLQPRTSTIADGARQSQPKRLRLRQSTSALRRLGRETPAPRGHSCPQRKPRRSDRGVCSVALKGRAPSAISACEAPRKTTDLDVAPSDRCEGR